MIKRVYIRNVFNLSLLPFPLFLRFILFYGLSHFLYSRVFSYTLLRIVESDTAKSIHISDPSIALPITSFYKTQTLKGLSSLLEEGRNFFCIWQWMGASVHLQETYVEWGQFWGASSPNLLLQDKSQIGNHYFLVLYRSFIGNIIAQQANN